MACHDDYCKLTSPLPHWNLENKSVFVRADLNVPLRNGKILDDSRLQAIRPTLDYILEHGGRITLGTHLDRPHGFEQKLSTNPIRQWLDAQGYDTRITLLENLRFSLEEQARNPLFAQELAQGIDYYINDAFASLHDSDTSLTIMPTLFDAQHKGIGFLVERELQTLSAIKYTAEQPYLWILGGGKAVSKLPYLETLLRSDHNRVTDIMLCPGLSWPFWHLAQEKKRHTISPEQELLVHHAKTIIDLAQQKKVTLHVPQDYLVGTDGWNGRFVTKKAGNVSEDDTMIAIGADTVKLWSPLIVRAKTIFFNGPMGDLEQPETIETVKAVLHVITQSNAISIVGGGNSHAALQLFGLANAINFYSTGGGATLAYLSGQKLPALDALL